MTVGFEESIGFLGGSYARDKDAVVASMLIAEMTAYYKAKNMTLLDALEALYKKYGFSAEVNLEVHMEGVDGPERMEALMASLRASTPSEIGGVSVSVFGDYTTESFTNMISGEKTPTGLPKANVLVYNLEGGSQVVVRPSGTEPKIKLYYLIQSDTEENAHKTLESIKLAVTNYLDI